ncbi:hypothetical protein [Nocardioides ferulae]|uniref:hypothetical protein n=1 Tax=Nocardioides ferulae TaxID=2340821 RepID=UPI000EAF3B7F|nr:hypothetical protein [Nocardioides ferulae]
MTGVSPETPLENVAEEVPPSTEPDAEEYLPSEAETESTDTGTVYDSQGEAEATPHDLTEDADEEAQE